jgi:predicted nucleotidyltransferase
MSDPRDWYKLDRTAFDVVSLDEQDNDVDYWRSRSVDERMETLLPNDFKEFLRLANSARIEYLLIGGYAVSFHGYPRPTGDLDVWIAAKPESAATMAKLVREFGFASATPELFLTPGKVIRMGRPPVRIEIMNAISGVDFSDAYDRRVETVLDGVPVNIIALDDLLNNKRAAGRGKDLDDVRHLERR